MKISIMQPYFLPYLNYFKLISSSDYFFILNDVNFPKKKFVNRNFFTTYGKLSWVLPIEKISQNKKICEHNFYNFEINKLKLKNIFISYFKKSEYFDQSLLDNLFFSINDRVDLFIKDSLQIILDYLEINTRIMLTSEIENINGSGQDRILNICEYFGASEYINLPTGRNIYNYDDFNRKKIKLSFISEIDDKTPKSSILDLIFSEGKESVINMIKP